MRSKGFTLIELLVAMAVSSIVLVFIFNLFFSGLRTFGRISNTINDQGTAVFVLDKISNDILESDGILFGSNDKKLVLLGTEMNVSYEYLNSKVKRQAGVTTRYLTVEDDVSGIQFVYVGNGVKVVLKSGYNQYEQISFPRRAK